MTKTIIRNSSKKLKIAILGAGAMGSLFYYHFNRAGFKCTLYDNDLTLLSLMKNNLYMHIKERIEHVVPDITGDIKHISDHDIFFLFVKSYSTDEACRDLAASLKDNSTIISLQNGLGNIDIMRQYFDDSRILYGITTMGAAKADPVTVVQGGTGEILIGGKTEERLGPAVDLLMETGFSVSAIPDPDRAVWEKAIINAAINPLGALYDIPNGEIIENPYLVSIQEKIISEAVEVANHLKVSITAEQIAVKVNEVCRKTSINLCSMLQDIRAGRPTEIDSINGKISGMGIGFGMAVPINTLVTAMIKAKETMVSLKK